MTYATYVYAVRRTGGPEIHSPGHDGGGPVRLLPLGSLTAVVQDVPAAEFTGEALRQRFTDRLDLERCARTHHRVVSAAAAGAATVPLPLATLYANDVRTKVVLEEHAELLSEALHRVAGHVEWAVKVHRDTAVPLLEPEPETGTPAAPVPDEPATGREYPAGPTTAGVPATGGRRARWTPSTWSTGWSAPSPSPPYAGPCTGWS